MLIYNLLQLTYQFIYNFHSNIVIYHQFNLVLCLVCFSIAAFSPLHSDEILS